MLRYVLSGTWRADSSAAARTTARARFALVYARLKNTHRQSSFGFQSPSLESMTMNETKNLSLFDARDTPPLYNMDIS